MIEKMVVNTAKRGFSSGAAGVIGGLVDGGISAYENIGAYARGEKEGWDAVGCVAKDAAGGVVSGCGGAAAGAAVGTAIGASVLAGTALGPVIVVAAPMAAAIGAGCLISCAWHKLFD